MKLLKAFFIAKVFIRFDAINKIIKGFIFIKAFIKRVVIKINFRSDKGASLSCKLAKEF